jgi:hypothetical protein
VEELVAAYDGICRRHADVDLLLAWSGVGEGRGIERLIAEKGMCHRVKVLGALDPRVVLRASHLAVFPYRTLHGHSLLPSAIIEALAIGTPVLVPRHAIFSALDGLLHFCSNTSSEELERCIDEIISGRTSVMKGVELETAYRARMDPATLGGKASGQNPGERRRRQKDVVEVGRIRFRREAVKDAAHPLKPLPGILLPREGGAERRHDDPAGDPGLLQADFERLEARCLAGEGVLDVRTDEGDLHEVR